jgi:hypothetical protein
MAALIFQAVSLTQKWTTRGHSNDKDRRKPWNVPLGMAGRLQL